MRIGAGWGPNIGLTLEAHFEQKRKEGKRR